MSERFIHIRGYEELDRRLKELPAKVEAKLLRNALRAAARVIEAEVDRRVPRKTGAMAETVRVSTSIKPSKGLVTAKVVVGNKKGVFYPLFVERGTKAHTIAVKVAKRLAIGGGSVGVVFATSVQHPGAKPEPFMAPALAASADAAVEACAQYLRDHLAEAVE